MTSNTSVSVRLRHCAGGNWGIVTSLTFAVFRGPPLYTFGHYCINSTREDVTALLRLVSLNNAQMPREINIDITYDSDLTCLWVVYQGPQTHLSDLLAPLLQSPASPPLVSSLVQQFKLDQNKFNVQGFGWEHPADSTDPQNHAKNRRVEVKIYTAEAE